MIDSVRALRLLAIAASLLACCSPVREPSQVAAATAPPGPLVQPGAAQADPGNLGHSVAETLRSPVSDCEAAVCAGNTTSVLIEAVRTRAGEVRACYEQALKQTPTLGGRVIISWRVARDGRSCPVQVMQNELADAGTFLVCLRQTLEQNYPLPQGGCVELQLPLKFVPEYIESDAGLPGA
jgi:hypothetical protein